MFAKQLSVFIENRQGRLCDVLNELKNGGINVYSMSLADTTEYGLLRLIVSDPVKGKKVLESAGFSTMTTDVLIISIENKAGSLQGLLALLDKNGIGFEYMYGLSVAKEGASVVLKATDMKKAIEVLYKNGVKTISEVVY